MDLVTIMRRSELFRGLSDDQLQRLTSISTSMVYHRGEVIFEQGTIGDRMYIIAQGQVEVRVHDRTSGEGTTAVYLGQGQVIGEMALIDSGRRSATLVAFGDNTTLYSIPKDEFTALCQQDTAIGYIMMRNLALDLSFKMRHHDNHLSGQ
jgi:CRP-like cAMP-binding protein